MGEPMLPLETRFLIVDDNSMMRRILTRDLTALGFKMFYEAENGSLGLNILSDQHGMGAPIDLVFSDWAMPQMQGIDFLRAIRKDPRFNHLPFLMITAKGDGNMLSEAIREGVTDYM